ncbi:hypothetical protein BJY59DRAFT_591538 [Rhodotorula toruloides]
MVRRWGLSRCMRAVRAAGCASIREREVVGKGTGERENRSRRGGDKRAGVCAGRLRKRKNRAIQRRPSAGGTISGGSGGLPAERGGEGRLASASALVRGSASAKTESERTLYGLSRPQAVLSESPSSSPIRHSHQLRGETADDGVAGRGWRRRAER